MPEKAYPEINKLLSSTKPEELKKGLDLVRREISKGASHQEAEALFELVSSVLAIDPLERPDLMPVLDEAISLLAGFGDWVIPLLVQSLDTGDMKARWAVAHALGQIGAKAINPLLTEYLSAADTTHQAFILNALGKIKSQEVLQLAPQVLEAVRSPELELRDAATRVIGSFANVIPPAQLKQDIRIGFLNGLYANLSDENSGVRAKAIRSLGKLAQYGHLSSPERATLMERCLAICGQDDHFQWDKAYIVRKEAKQVLNYVFVNNGRH